MLPVNRRFISLLVTCLFGAAAARSADAEWHSLFNGRDLAGWTVKITGHELGDNYRDTFRVEDGILKVDYSGYESFDGRFGHLYSDSPYSHYVLRLDYKLTGDSMAGAPPWIHRNSGVMVHSQSPLSMRLDQDWPVSLECQFLAEGTSAGRQTGNACTPGTNLVFNGTFSTDHIIEATSRLYPMDEWIHIEVEVHGHERVIHRVNGVEVLRYERPTLDERDPDARRLLAAGAPPEISFGHIALQAEGQTVWFRNIEIRPLQR